VHFNYQSDFNSIRSMGTTSDLKGHHSSGFFYQEHVKSESSKETLKGNYILLAFVWPKSFNAVRPVEGKVDDMN
jgi:pyridoxine/pyridoxamine 5'-phosphate oxidase